MRPSCRGRIPPFRVSLPGSTSDRIFARHGKMSIAPKMREHVQSFAAHPAGDRIHSEGGTMTIRMMTAAAAVSLYLAAFTAASSFAASDDAARRAAEEQQRQQAAQQRAAQEQAQRAQQQQAQQRAQ